MTATTSEVATPPPPPPAAEGRAVRRGSGSEPSRRRLSLPRRNERGPRRRRDDRRARSMRLVAMSLTILASLCAVFVLSLSWFGSFMETRDQKTLYDTFRFELASGTAPVGQLGIDGQVLPPGTPVALIDIPVLSSSLVVVEGTTSGLLMSGPGHRRDTVLPGQQGVSVVLGRRAAYGGPFGRIATLKPGDQITATTGQAVSTYKVIGVRKAGDPIPPAALKGRLVLVTAGGDPWSPDGVVFVDADLVTDAQPANARVITTASLSEAERPLQGDPSAWIGVLLWAQALLVAAIGVTFAWARWGRWEAWLVGLPVVLAIGVALSNQVAQLLPNLL